MTTKKGNTHLTRWQVRVYPDLEKVIREKAEKDYRSINKTVLLILEEYFSNQKEITFSGTMQTKKNEQ